MSQRRTSRGILEPPRRSLIWVSAKVVPVMELQLGLFADARCSHLSHVHFYDREINRNVKSDEFSKASPPLVPAIRSILMQVEPMSSEPLRLPRRQPVSP